MNTIKHYLSIYKMYVATSVSEASSFRLNFVLLIVMDIFFYLSALLTVSFIYDHISTIGPWNRDQLLFFVAFMLTIDHLHMTLLSESFWILSEDIKTGRLDYTLLKPVHSIFIVFFRYFRPSSFINIIFTWSALIYYGLKVDLPIVSWILLPLLVLLSFILLAIIEFIITTSMFWLTEGLGINILRMQFQQLARWPDFIYNPLAKRALTFFFPILVIGSAPVKFLLQPTSASPLLGLLVAIIASYFFLIFIWKKAIAHYDSASS